MAPLGRSQNLPKEKKKREMSIVCPYLWLLHKLKMIIFFGPSVFEDYVKDVECSLP